MFCQNCGVEVNEQSNFCLRCGAPINQTTENQFQNEATYRAEENYRFFHKFNQIVAT